MNEVLHQFDELFEAELVVRVQVGDSEEFVKTSLRDVLLPAHFHKQGLKNNPHFGPAQRVAGVSVIVFEKPSGQLYHFNFGAHSIFYNNNKFHELNSYILIYLFGIHQTEQALVILYVLYQNQRLNMSTRIVTQIKRGVEEVRMRQYSAQKQKKELKYYSLYLRQIVTIQRCFRKFLVAKTRGLEEEITSQLSAKQLLHFQHKRLAEQINTAKARRDKLRNFNIHKMVEAQKENISQNMREMIRNVVNCADNYAKNTAVSKISMGDLQKLRKEEREIKAQVKELELEKHCSERRIANWNQKLKELREKIMEELSLKTQIERQLSMSP